MVKDRRVIGLVDDEEVFHWITQQNVNSLDVECSFMSFFNGEEVFEYLSSSPEVVPNVLLLDLNMPVCNGWRFLENYSSNVKSGDEMDIYILSSSIDPEDKIKASNYTMVKEFISKPITKEFLNEAIRKAS